MLSRVLLLLVSFALLGTIVITASSVVHDHSSDASGGGFLKETTFTFNLAKMGFIYDEFAGGPSDISANVIGTIGQTGWSFHRLNSGTLKCSNPSGGGPNNMGECLVRTGVTTGSLGSLYYANSLPINNATTFSRAIFLINKTGVHSAQATYMIGFGNDHTNVTQDDGIYFGGCSFDQLSVCAKVENSNTVIETDLEMVFDGTTMFIIEKAIAGEVNMYACRITCKVAVHTTGLPTSGFTKPMVKVFNGASASDHPVMITAFLYEIGSPGSPRTSHVYP